MGRRRDDDLRIDRKDKNSLTSIAGTLDRLVKAGYTVRRVDTVNGRVRYVYAPVHTEEEVASEITTKIMDSLVDTFGRVAIENFSKYSDKK